MAKNRMINTRFWIDDYISNLDPIEKLLFLYCLTNPYTDISGVYEIPIKHIALETGLDKEMVLKILDRFSADDKIFYSKGWVAVKNFGKHQLDNPKVKKGIEIGLKSAPKELVDRLCIDYDRLSHSNSNSNLNSNTNVFSIKNVNNNLLKEMYNYTDIDEDGNPVLKKRSKKITKEENTNLIKIGLLWRKMCAKYLKVEEQEVVMKNIYYPIRAVYDSEKYLLKDFEDLFKYFLEDKNIKYEDKMAFDLMLSQKYVAKFKLKKKQQDKPVSNYQIAEKFKL